ncbi:site-specific DNA-methyltransferase [Basfia succiniciproducens]|uniref:site-specific DNA-methyltransferase n=1 Tax=Basfia succiniciproducens TaxID=653940 RepID=UPI0008AFBB29|nr:site-specific DNA-methyltransferase [Basfia succiniciproducens]SEQ54539.1 adenine-specific DNA-methyltransferase [Basfia succiniciproducens]
MITETLFNAENITANSPQLEQLKQLFPNCFDTSGRFLLEKFQAEIAQHTDISREFYSMNWLGKSYAKLLRNLPPETLLAEDVEHNTKPENANSKNVLIQGDNLEVLKHLKNAYRNSVKMIYIDPPYNTGSDGFVYQDDRKFTPEQLATLANITQEEAERILNFTDKGSNSHSAWLTFMYPRLYVARELLKEDGVIFISIDDNEVAQLKLLCDEVFGEGNFRNQIAVKRGTKSVQAQFENIDKLGIAYEYILVYSKNSEYRLPKFYFELEEQKEGTWNNHWRGTDRPTMRYEILGKNIETGQWRWSKERSEIAIENYNRLLRDLGEEPSQKDIDKWYFENEEVDLLRLSKTGKPEHFIAPTNKKFGHNLWTDLTVGKSSVLSALNLNIFDNPKNPELIERMAKWVTKPNDLILDFFAGSGTTAHAVMQLNAEDGGNRQFILVQLPEQTDTKSEAYKAGYKTIFEITKARIERAAIFVGAEFISAQNGDAGQKIDLGFKIYQTTDNFNAVAEDEFHPNQAQLPNLTSLTKSQIQTLLTTWRVYDGAKLTETVQAVDLGGYIAYLCDKRLYLLNEHFNSQHLLTFIQRLDNDTAFNPNRVIVFGNHIESAMQQELNQALASYSNRKNISLSLIVRA